MMLMGMSQLYMAARYAAPSVFRMPIWMFRFSLSISWIAWAAWLMDEAGVASASQMSIRGNPRPSG